MNKKCHEIIHHFKTRPDDAYPNNKRKTQNTNYVYQLKSKQQILSKQKSCPSLTFMGHPYNSMRMLIQLL